ncbi:unnamed protein product [Orchesella dallaii]|uniref:STI1/HOP DP domain-containing protein n=1 Tax=Orchesella dallaii TaxID=48710 RepID=A0ABP1QI47_9HEXA
MADNEGSNDGSSSGWTEVVIGKPYANVLQYVGVMKKMKNTEVESFEPPNFLHPFADPELFQKLKNDRRTSGWLEDPEYVSLMKEFQEHPEAYDEKYQDPKFHSKIVLTLRVLLFGKDSNAYGDKTPPPGTGILQPDLVAVWMGGLYVYEEESINRANAEKDEGNAAYKNGNYAKALEHYHKAVDYFPYDMKFLMNIGAVSYASGNYAQCIRESLDAVEVGRENRFAKQFIAKALMRVGNSYKQLGDYHSAKIFYQKS